MKDFSHIPSISEPTDEKDWRGETGLIPETVERYHTDYSNYEAYLCGPPIMIDKTSEVLEKHGINKNRVYYDKFYD